MAHALRPPPGSPAASAEHVDELDADLIAVGTHGPGLVGRLLLGSVASSILHLSTTHVLASRAPAPVRSGRQSPVTYRVRGW